MPNPRPQVNGLNLDPHTRCAHFNSPTDIIAIKMKCCGADYACKESAQTVEPASIQAAAITITTTSKWRKHRTANNKVRRVPSRFVTTKSQLATGASFTNFIAAEFMQ
jgi:uncharacterized CHY-type Zn-finger protein